MRASVILVVRHRRHLGSSDGGKRISFVLCNIVNTVQTHMRAYVLLLYSPTDRHSRCKLVTSGGGDDDDDDDDKDTTVCTYAYIITRVLMYRFNKRI